MDAPSRRRKKKRSYAAITMMDVIKSNGMRVVEGTKLNLVAKGIDCIGTVVLAIAQSTTCLYLSQNNIASLDGLAQFTRLKVLSLGGNLLSRFDEFDSAAPHLPSLRTLLLSGNPLCDAPNYRLRLIYAMPMVQTLDGADVTPKERDIAPFLVAQDTSLRHVVHENHMEISKLEWIVLLIQMHKEFYQVVYGAHGSPLRCHDRMPHLEKMAADVALLLRLMKQADAEPKASPVEPYHRHIEDQLQRVVVRAHGHLQQHPLRKAKQLLQKFGNQRLKNLEPPSPPSWEEAYASVISLQQNTMAKLRGLCERNRRDLIDALKSLLIRDPDHRLHQARHEDEQRRMDLTNEREQLLREYQSHSDRQPSTPSQGGLHAGLPPQLPDPDDGVVAGLRQAKARAASKVPTYSHRSTKSPDPPVRHTGPISHPRNASQLSPTPPPPPPSSSSEFASHRRGGYRIHENLIAKVSQVDESYNAEMPTVPATEENVSQLAAPHAAHPDSSEMILKRQLDLVEKRLTDLDVSQGEERRIRRQETAALEQKLQDMQHNPVRDILPTDSFHKEKRHALHPSAPTAVAAPTMATPDPGNAVTELRPSNASGFDAPDASTRAAMRQSHVGSDAVQRAPAAAPPFSRHRPATAPTDNRTVREMPSSTKRNATPFAPTAPTSFPPTLVIPAPGHALIPGPNLMQPPSPTPRLRLSSSSLWCMKLRRLFRAWRHFVQVHQRLHMMQFQRLRRYARHVLASWRHHCDRQFHVRVFAATRDHRSLLRCFHKWANANRFLAIAAFAAARRAKDRLHHLVHAWKRWSRQAARVRAAQERQHHRRNVQVVRRVMAAWRQCTHVHLLRRIHEKQLHRVHAKYTLHVAFSGWRRWRDLHVQPRHHFELAVRTARVRRNVRDAFRALKALVAATRRFRKRTSLIVWRQWLFWVECRRQKARATRKIDRFVAKKAIAWWAGLAHAQKHHARMVVITRRQWMLHNLRQVWRHWTTYKSMRRKYVQGCLKAFKHHRVKLERRVWHAWAAATATHLHARKQQKQAKLADAFHRFRHAVHKHHARRHVDRRTHHLATRQALHWVQQCLTRWRVHTLQRRKPHGLLRYVRAQHNHVVLSRLWSCWRTRHSHGLQTRLQDAEATASHNEADRNRVMAEMLQLNDTTIQLAEQVATWKDAAKEKDDSIRSWKKSHCVIEQANAVLQQRVASLQQRLQEMEQSRRDQERLDEADRTQYIQQLVAAEESNEGLRRQLRDGHEELLQTQQQLTREREKHQRHNDDKRKLQHQLNQKHDELVKLQQALQRVEDTLAIERAERQDAAARCQDYEKRLADTVRAIQDHEAGVDSELRQTHDVALDMERRWKEAEAKNAELVKLLQEKNNCVAALTSQVQTHRSVESHRVSTLLEEVQANIQKSQLKTPTDPPQQQIHHPHDEIEELNAHTATIHDDIKALQNRIMLRLQQTPLEAGAVSRQGRPPQEPPKGKQRGGGGTKPATKPPAKPKPK